MEKQYKYISLIVILLVPLVIIAFYHSYFGNIFKATEHYNVLVHIHAVLSSSWILMLILQPILIFSGKRKFHKFLGKFSYVLFPLFILSFLPQILKNISIGNIRFLFFPISESILLIVFYSLAIFNRKNTSKHMRYMLSTAFVFLGPTLGRIGSFILEWPELLGQSMLYTMISLILITLILYDRSRGANYRPFVVVLFCYFVYAMLFYTVYI